MTVDKTAIGSSAPTGASNPDTAQTRPRPNARQQSGTAFSSDGFSLPDLEAETEVPPAYGELHDQIQLSQSGIQAGASVTEDGRVNININQKNRRLTDLLAPTLRQQLAENVDDAPLPPAYIPPSLGGQPGQTPPPPMNIVIQIVGSRGDVQPFVALGKILLEYGHRVRIATHATFQSFVEDAGLEFFCIGGDPAELMAFMVKNPGLMPGFDALKNGEISKRRKGIQDILLGCWRSCIEAGNGLGPPPKKHRRDQPLEETEVFRPGDQRPFVADAIIANPPSFAHIHIAEKLGIPLHMMFTMPWSPTRAFPHPLANIQSTNTDAVMTSYLSYALIEMMTWQGLGDVINRFRAKALDLDPISLIWAPGLLTRLRIPYTYCWSPALIPKPNDWGNNIDISGFFFLNLASSFTPDPDLAAFLEAGPPPVYIGFGSIVVDDPNALTTMIFEAVQATGIRALVSKGWGGLGAESIGVPDGVFMLGNVPHDWFSAHSKAEDEDYERAIQASVAETSRGNPEEDAQVEQAIRASVNQMRSSGQGLPGTKHPAADSDEGEEDLQITDQEYQELIEKAMQQSLTMSSAGIRPGEGAPDDDEDFKRALEASKIPSGQAHGDTHEDDLKRAIEASKSSNLADHDEELRRAIEESKTAHDDHRQKDQAARTEEDIVLEYVKKQSLAEDSFRSQYGKGKARVEDEDENDEDLRKAMEESLKMGRPDQGAGGSSA
ncbi:hypothetical protein BN1708_007123 [Verticillium longisporum]|uniref:Glycosyltransferase family 28 N-terminal domain-containing protein n=1 Tax=Verticillium longisporum TaxID=100787 RepID=A0A0G4MR85_VERLO|nr:hypothetical protein BN1708_007123 [Verticillium longisporum]